MIREWMMDLLIIYIAIMIMCGVIVGVIVMIGVVRMVIEEWKKGQK